MCDPERWSNGRNGMNHIYFFLPSSFPICPSILSSSDLLNCGRWRSRESTAKSEAIGTKNLLRGWRGNGEKHGVVGGGMEKGHTWKWRMDQSILSLKLSLFPTRSISDRIEATSYFVKTRQKQIIIVPWLLTIANRCSCRDQRVWNKRYMCWCVDREISVSNDPCMRSIERSFEIVEREQLLAINQRCKLVFHSCLAQTRFLHEHGPSSWIFNSRAHFSCLRIWQISDQVLTF